MRFLLDENFPKAAIGLLESSGHEAFDLRGTNEEGIDDASLFAKAQGLNAVLLTTDRDFFHTIPHLFASHAGVVVIALKQPYSSRLHPLWRLRPRPGGDRLRCAAG